MMDSELDKEAYWYGHIDAWKQSGQSQMKYCQYVGIRFSTFGYWRKRYNRTQKELTASSEGERGAQISLGRSLKHPALQILMPNGVRLGLNNERSPAMLGLVLQMVQTC